MEEKKVSTLFEEIKDDLSDYVSKRIRLAKLQAYAKTSNSGAMAVYATIIITLILFATSFIFTTLAIYLGETLGRMSLGFAIVALFFVFIALVIVMARKPIKNKLTNIFVAFLMDDDKKE